MENGGYKESFARKETKYHVPSGTYEKLLDELKAYVKPDVYGDTRIFNIYYDTRDYLKDCGVGDEEMNKILRIFIETI